MKKIKKLVSFSFLFIFILSLGAGAVQADTLAEKMERAGINTLIGMGTVFAVLIVICILIYCFKLLNKKPSNESTLTQSESSVSAVTQTSQAGSNLVQNTELVAVIAAAVAASMGTTSTDGFVVRSIKKRRR